MTLLEAALGGLAVVLGLVGLSVFIAEFYTPSVAALVAFDGSLQEHGEADPQPE